MNLNILIDNLPKTSFITIRKFKSLNINTYFDLLNYFPFRYENYSLISPINKLQPGETTTVIGTISDVKYQVTRTGLRIQVFKLEDGTGEVELGFYNQPYILRLIKKDMTLSVSGTVEKYGKKLVIKPKEYEIGGKKIHTGRIVPIYSEKRGLSSKTIREKIFYVLQNVMVRQAHHDTFVTLSLTKGDEILPNEIISFNNLIDEQKAYQQIHFPDSKEAAQKAKDRLAFDELFMIQLSSYLVKNEWKKEKVGYKFTIGNRHAYSLQQFINNLPFKLTYAQKRVWNEIRSDLLKTVPMNRFLQGEVGSGKTVVAALACYLAYLNGFQSLLMAPTEILAQQHFKTITDLFKIPRLAEFTLSEIEGLARDDRGGNLKIALITGSQKKFNFQSPSSKPVFNHQQLFSNFDIVIGTHSLISKKFKMDKVGLVIVDEQHRFGVSQRAALKEKGFNPHLLTMTATPIPRTVALTLYGELDISVIDEMPVGRLPVKTYFVNKAKRSSCYQWIKSQISNFQSQIFIVCPLIEESEIETMKSLKAAKKEFINLKNIFSDFKLGLLHGKMKAKEKEEIMTAFKNKHLDILVTTPVVEVGVDIPNATIMLIEGSERFGLAQLHQLRGRVGRSDKQSYCFLFSEKEDLGILKKLDFFTKTNDGNKLAEEDLKIRGPGDIYGIKQHGYLGLKIASLSDYKLIEKTKKAVEYFISHYKVENYPILLERIDKERSGKIAKD